MEKLSARDYRILYLYEYKLGHNGAMAARNINSAFGAKVVSERTIRFWFKKFARNDFGLGNQLRGRPKPSIQKEDLRAVLEKNPNTSVRELATKFKVSIGTISNYLRAIGRGKMQRVGCIK